MKKSEIQKNKLDLRYQDKLTQSNIAFASTVPITALILNIGQPNSNLVTKAIISTLAIYALIIFGIMRRNDSKEIMHKMDKLIEDDTKET